MRASKVCCCRMMVVDVERVAKISKVDVLK